jgi:RNA polymerase sigma-70 factor (ECF subfamily)
MNAPPRPSACPEPLAGWLVAAAQSGASDLHVVAHHPPVLRLHGHLQALIGDPPGLTGRARSTQNEIVGPFSRQRVRADMDDTSLSLFDRIRLGENPEDWQRLVDLYTPLLKNWVRRSGLQDSDADDVVQDVLLALAAELPRFVHNQRPGAFRTWLRKTLVHRLRRHFQDRQRHPLTTGDTVAIESLEQLEDPHSELSAVWDRQHDQHVLQRLLEEIEPRFSETTRRAFRRLVFDGASPSDVARELGLSRNAVVVAKCRVLKELRREAGGLMDE